mmetsp:Transcript_56515/g.89754  ORF Transcript_56515/g.89754 Transcript_56515/m.89754 type:complete len:117 (-) Transcript_56515:17-367(-)
MPKQKQERKQGSAEVGEKDGLPEPAPSEIQQQLAGVLEYVVTRPLLLLFGALIYLAIGAFLMSMVIASNLSGEAEIQVPKWMWGIIISIFLGVIMFFLWMFSVSSEVAKAEVAKEE